MPLIFQNNLNYRIGSDGHMFSRVKEVKKTKNIDVLFIGSSHAYRGFDTRYFTKNGIRSFNLGSSSQTPIQSLLLMKRYLDKLSPRLVVLDVYPVILSNDGVESAVDIISNDKNDLLSLKMALEINNTKVYNTLVYSLFQEQIGAFDKYSEPTLKNGDTYINGGYVSRKISFNKPARLPKSIILLNKNQLIALNEIIGFLKKRGIPVLLVYAPITSGTYNRYTNNQSFDSTMSKLSYYYNFNNIMNMNDTLHFYDDDHLNQLGVSLFNNKLLEIMNEYLESSENNR